MPSLNDNVNASGIAEATTKPDTRRKPVRPPRFITYSMSSIFGAPLPFSPRAVQFFRLVYLAWLQDDLVTFNPDYQQSTSSKTHLVLSLTSTFTGIAWPNAKQVGLINSLFNNYHITPIIFSTFGAPPISTFSCFPQV